jgi:hypothetical protein
MNQMFDDGTGAAVSAEPTQAQRLENKHDVPHLAGRVTCRHGIAAPEPCDRCAAYWNDVAPTVPPGRTEEAPSGWQPRTPVQQREIDDDKRFDLALALVHKGSPSAAWEAVGIMAYLREARLNDEKAATADRMAWSKEALVSEVARLELELAAERSARAAEKAKLTGGPVG